VTVVLAHGPFATPETLWSVPASSLVVMLLAGAILVRVVRSAGHRHGPLGPHDRLRLAGFGVGGAVIVAAVFSPLHALADALFAAHMVQHLLLITVGAPLVVRGAPAVLGRPRPTDRLPLWHLPVATAVLVVTFTLWHASVLYEAAVADVVVHGVEHATMLGAALWYWIAIGAAVARGHDLAAVGAIGVSGLAGVALGALLALSPEPWYAVHADGAAAWGVDLLADQQLGGMIMWVLGGAANLFAASVLVVRFLSRHEDPARPAPPVPVRG
jgi:putative membrane protein